MDLDSALNRLGELGAPVEELTNTLSLSKDERGSIHTMFGCCLATGPIFAQYDPEASKCPCTYSFTALSSSPLWQAAVQLVRWAQSVEDTELGYGVLDRRRMVRLMQQPFRSVREEKRSLWDQLPQLEVARENTLAIVGAKYDELKARMRTPEARAELLERAAESAKPSEHARGGRFLVGIESYNPTRVEDDLADAIVLSYWETMAGLGNFPLVLPGALVDHLDEYWEGTWGYLTVAHQLTGADTQSVVETAAKLWAPHGDGEMRDLGNALEAARRI